MKDIESTLTAIRELKEERDWLDRKLCGLLATLSLDRNREALRSGDPKAMLGLFLVVDAEMGEYSRRFPESKRSVPFS